MSGCWKEEMFAERQMNAMHLSLIGFMGSATTVGKMLAMATSVCGHRRQVGGIGCDRGGVFSVGSPCFEKRNKMPFRGVACPNPSACDGRWHALRRRSHGGCVASLCGSMKPPFEELLDSLESSTHERPLIEGKTGAELRQFVERMMLTRTLRFGARHVDAVLAFRRSNR